MPFSFNPGQEQTGSAPAAPVATTNNNGVPALNVPVAPQISLTPVVEAVSPFAYRNRGKSKFSVYFQSAIFLIFAFMVISSVGLFSYQSMIKLQISSRKETLDTLQAGFKKPKDLEDMQRLSSRLALINKIINERASVRTAFRIVEESINSPVVYNKFSLSKSKKNVSYDLSIAGETNSYQALYQQIEILNGKLFAAVFPKIAITGIGPLNNKGIASFKVDASVAISGIDPDDGFTVIHKSNSSASSTTILDNSTTTDSVPLSTVDTSTVKVNP